MEICKHPSLAISPLPAPFLVWDSTGHPVALFLFLDDPSVMHVSGTHCQQYQTQDLCRLR